MIAIENTWKVWTSIIVGSMAIAIVLEVQSRQQESRLKAAESRFNAAVADFYKSAICECRNDPRRADGTVAHCNVHVWHQSNGRPKFTIACTYGEPFLAMIEELKPQPDKTGPGPYTEVDIKIVPGLPLNERDSDSRTL